MARAAIGHSAKRFGLRPGTWMTDGSCKDRLGNPRQTHSPISWDSPGGRKEGASTSLHGGAGRRFRLALHHRAGMPSATPAARRKFRVRIRCENRRTDQRKAEQSHQHYCRYAMHQGHCTPIREIVKQSGSINPQRGSNGIDHVSCRIARVS